MLKSLSDALAAFILWFRGVGIGDRLVPELASRVGAAPAPPPLEPTAGTKRLPERVETKADGPGRLIPADVLVARYAKAGRETTALEALPFDDTETDANDWVPSTREWMSALLEDHGVTLDGAAGVSEGVGHGVGALPGGGTSVLGRNERGPLRRGERLTLLELKGTPKPEDLLALRGFPAGIVPPGPPAHRELVHTTYDLGKLHLLQRLASEPLFTYACRMWKPGDRERNLELAYALHDRLGRLMGSVFDFEPAPLATGSAMPKRLHACYDEVSGQLYLSSRHLVGTLPDLMEAMAHQQAHCLQHAVIRRLRDDDQKLGDHRRTLAAAWSKDFERWRATCRPLAIGYHAHDLGGAVGQLFKTMEIEERLQPSGPTPPEPRRV